MLRPARPVALALSCVVLSSLAGCYESGAVSLGSGDYTPDGAVPDAGAVDLPCTRTLVPRPVDLLFVVDDSPSMAEEQALLAMQLPRLVNALTSGDRDGDGTQDFAPVTDLHAGAITVNMGVGGIPNVPTCMRNSDFGDDGILLTTPRLAVAGCAASYPPFLTYAAGTTSAAAFGTDLTCLARTGTMGCGFEQQLDAMLKAVAPSTSPVRFFGGTTGHGDDPATNGGFVRQGSLLAIVLITDEDDCSTDHTDLWNPASVTHTGDLNLRCIHYFSELYPVSRFVAGLRALGSEVVFLAITGVPQDLLAPGPGEVSIDYARVLADPRMQNTVVTTGGTQSLQPACSTSGTGSAAPAIRIAELAQALGPTGLLASICQPDYAPAVDALVSLVAPRSTTTICAAP